MHKFVSVSLIKKSVSWWITRSTNQSGLFSLLIESSNNNRYCSKNVVLHNNCDWLSLKFQRDFSYKIKRNRWWYQLALKTYGLTKLPVLWKSFLKSMMEGNPCSYFVTIKPRNFATVHYGDLLCRWPWSWEIIVCGRKNNLNCLTALKKRHGATLVNS